MRTVWSAAALCAVFLLPACENSAPIEAADGGSQLAATGGGNGHSTTGGGTGSTGGGMSATGGGTAVTGGGTGATGGGTAATGGGAGAAGGGSATGGGSAATGGGTAATGGGSGGGACTPPAFATPATKTVEAVIITNNVLAPSFETLAALHTVTGIGTEVLTIESICAKSTCNNSDPKQDTVKAIRDALKARAGLRYVILGGGGDIVPARSVHDEYKNPLLQSYSFSADFVTDYYYSDFSEWDTNNNGIYAEKDIDEPGYLPTLSVARIPVHTTTETDAYIAKVIKHLTTYNGAHAQKATLLSNIATEYSGIQIDAAYYFEAKGKTKELIPDGFTIEKLYADTFPKVDSMADTYSVNNVEQSFVGGVNLMVHSGHAAPSAITIEIDGSEAFTGSHAFGLSNQTAPIFLSSGCEAGDYSTSYRAGERLIQAPNGGAIAYLGNAPVGLGLAGGMQMIDELLRYVKTTPAPRLADAYQAAHQNLPKQDTFKIPFLNLPVPVVDQSSYQWTQKSVLLFGDHLIPVWKTAVPTAPALTAADSSVCQGTSLKLTFAAPVSGSLRVLDGSSLYEIALNNQSEATLVLGSKPSKLTLGFASTASQYAYQVLSL